MDVYVYYRVASADAQALKALILPMQLRLTQHYGVVAALKRRPHEEAGMQTWMEVYSLVPEEFDDILQQAASKAGLPALIHGERHVEHFLDIAPCA